MSAESRRSRYADPKLEMAPMIDVVFLLLIFFLVVTRPVDLIAHLDVSRPQFEGGTRPLTALRIEVLPSGHRLNDRLMGLSEMDRAMDHLARYSTDLPVVITCAPDSAHDGLVQVLNLCAKNDLHDLSLLSRK